jgi:exopolysaccharide biosynthesis polyprenyl glycosylphosphotransferase
MLLAADLSGVALAYTISRLALPSGDDARTELWKALVLVATLPVWVVLAKLLGLYDRDEERTDHYTADDIGGVFNLVTIGTWMIVLLSWATPLDGVHLGQAIIFWAAAIALILGFRAAARGICHRMPAYQQNTVIVGAGQIGQLAARKITQHPEYGLNLLGFVDPAKEQRSGFAGLPLLGSPAELADIVRRHGIERVIFAFTGADERLMQFARKLRDLDVQIDVVPRFFELVGATVSIHSLEGLPLLGLPPARLARSSRLIKRCVDVTFAAAAVVLTAPLFAYIALRIKHESSGPVFFRQVRLGQGMREFTVLKFRTMYEDTSDSDHREYIRESMSSQAPVNGNGLFKLERKHEVTPFGAWLRKTSLDELPQLVNVLRGEMSLIGPRPCIPYETEHFEPHHFDRFLVPQGMTGLWQVTARAHSTFREALDMDVAYVHGWSLGLDLRLLLRTPLRVLTGSTS